MSKRPAITYADSQADLPSNDFAERLRELRITRLFAANGNESQEPKRPGRAQMRDPSMVEQDRPYPAPRPTPDFAADVDAASFNARWEAERTRAAHSLPPTKGEKTMSDDITQRPQETLREGSLKAAIWRNESERGAYHSVTLARTYKDRERNLQDTSSFSAKDMLGLSELARGAHHHAHDLDRAAFKEQRQQQASQGREQDQDRSR